ncbi:MAG: hypothetical protein DWB56_02790 [Candidatus Jettenia sp.]|nr:MAG: hypothetical protein EDM77_02070 [Candidatus Jettenia sp. AMX1]MBC6927884.1 hypothetical protein [Candidatus Jettenia sp.]NUN24556.1 hypothetical protein [Candidatus Jettenia caeni]MCE7880316.1 hypothetical protein [Candidatus Jettenia sp. AMX1]MCQ3926151.1 hypothetical protein [Candidatus Jettenia sp.]
MANRIVLGQYKCNDKSNEITAIPELLRLLDIHRWMLRMQWDVKRRLLIGNYQANLWWYAIEH